MTRVRILRAAAALLLLAALVASYVPGPGPRHAPSVHSNGLALAAVALFGLSFVVPRARAEEAARRPGPAAGAAPRPRAASVWVALALWAAAVGFAVAYALALRGG